MQTAGRPGPSCSKGGNAIQWINTIQWIAWFILLTLIHCITTYLARVVRKVDNAVHRINHYPAGSVVCFVNIYLLNSDLFGRWIYSVIQLSNNCGLAPVVMGG